MHKCIRLSQLACDMNGQIYSWGDAVNGKLGHPVDDGFKCIISYPKKINYFNHKSKITMCAASN